ncbi:hypothetical protein SASPL_155554 [Salvia splendens]|uniref:GAG-pre-integrase domain-containing protein n=1 Tax=Salvia splendens TaxID=180675 RepID=A0A8X8VYC0_SALSN|nr:hypothetical protein SASPL_155554 [Salvia splendens]
MMRDEILKATLGALVMLKGLRKNNLYYYQGSTVARIVATATSSNKKDAEATKLWHLRLGHAGERSLQILVNQGLLKGTKSCKLEFCEHCVMRKQRRVIFGTAIHDTKGILDYVHSDVWGPAKTPSLGVEKVHYMLSTAGLDRKFWADAITYVQHIVYRLPCSAIDGKTPLEVNPNSSDASQQVEYTPKQMEFEEAVEIPTTNTTNDSPTEEDLLRKKKSKMIKRYHPKNLRSNQCQL